MRPRTLLSALGAAGLAFILACGGSRTLTDADVIEKCLPGSLPSLGLVRSGDILRFGGDSLFNYINGAAEVYYKYDFEEVHVGKYVKDGGEITVDIYRFAGPDRAFGMYTTLRPTGPDTVALGVEGFAYGPILVYSKGPYMVNVQTYDDAVFTGSDMIAVAAAVEKDLPGTRNMPDTFGLFPDASRVPHSEKIFAESYLGRGFLTDVYTVAYSFEAGDVTLFITHDADGGKLRQWSEAASASETGPETPSMPYERGRALLFGDRYYGIVVAGIKGGRLAGMVGYSGGHEQALREWLEALPQATAQ
jgi:hypothetical protein